jgi:hypothetical protein
MRTIALATLLALSVSTALADDFKTIDGKEYKSATVKRVEPDGIVLSGKSGTSKVYFAKLPKEVQERYHYDPEKAAAYSAAQNAASERVGKQQRKALRQKAKETRKNNEQVAKEGVGIPRTAKQLQNVEALEARYEQLQQQEADLLSQIGGMQTLPDYVQGRSGRHYYSYKNPLRANLPVLQSRLSDVRREKGQVREQLEQAQH